MIVCAVNKSAIKIITNQQGSDCKQLCLNTDFSRAADFNVNFPRHNFIKDLLCSNFTAYFCIETMIYNLSKIMRLFYASIGEIQFTNSVKSM